MRDLPFRSAGQQAARLPSRAEIRDLTTQHQEELRQVVRAGGNPHQRSLDQMDKVRQYAALLSLEDGTLFLTMYAEETQALTAHVEAQTRRMVAEHAAREASYSYFNPRPLDQQSLGEKIGRGLVGAVVLLLLFQWCR